MKTKSNPRDPWTHPTHYWRHYFSKSTQSRADEIRRTLLIESRSQPLHIDVYYQPNRDAPVVVFFHGGGGYARLFTGLAVALHHVGFNVVVPDMSGQGFSAGNRCDFLFSDFIVNGLDTISWVRREFKSPIILSGASMGSMLAYGTQAALTARGLEPAQAIVTSNLYDPASLEQMLGVTRFNLFPQFGIDTLFASTVKYLSHVWPRFTVPYKPMAKFKNMVDDPSGEFYAHYKRDPNPIRKVSLRYIESLIAYRYEVPLSLNKSTIWVVNPTQDRMTSPSLTQDSYNELGGSKRYIEWSVGHFSVEEEYNVRFAELIRNCFEETAISTKEKTKARAFKSIG